MNKLAFTLSLIISVLTIQAQENCQVFTGDVSFNESVFNGTIIINPTGDINVGAQYNKPEEKLELIYAYIEFQLEQVDDPAVEGMDLSERLDYLQRKEQKLATEQAQIEANRKELVVQEKRVKDIEQKFQANIDAESRRIENLVASNAAKLAKDPLIKEKIEEKLAQKDRIVESTKACLLNNFSLVPIQDVATGNISYGFSLDEIRRDPNYVLIDDYHEGMARVRRNNKFGFYDKKGQLAIPFKYDYAEAFAGGRALVQNLGKWFLIDKSGQKIIILNEQKDFTYVKKFTTICPNVYAYKATSYSSFDKFFYFDQEELEKWDHLDAFNENGIAFFARGFGYNRLTGVVNRQGQILLPAEYKSIEDSKAYPGYFLIEKSFDEKGLIDPQGKTILPARFYQIYDYDFWDYPKHNLILVELKGGKEGVYHLSGKEVFAPEYGAFNFRDPYLMVGKEGKNGLFTLTGKPIIDIQYDNFRVRSDRIEIEKDSLWGFATLQGEVLVPPRYLSISGYETNILLKVQNKKGKYGVIDRKGKEIIPTQYRFIQISDALKIIVVKNEGFEKAIFNFQGQVLSPLQKCEILWADVSSGKVENYIAKLTPTHVFLHLEDKNELIFLTPQQEFTSLGQLQKSDVLEFYQVDANTFLIKSYGGNSWLFNQNYTLSEKFKLNERFLPAPADRNGNIKLSSKWKSARIFLINDQLEKISEVYEEIRICSNGMYLVKGYQKIGFIDAQGQPVTRLRFHTAYPFGRDNHAIVSVASEQYGIIDQYGAEAVVPVFTKIKRTESGFTLHVGRKKYTLDKSLQCNSKNAEEYKNIVKAYHQQKRE